MLRHTTCKTLSSQTWRLKTRHSHVHRGEPLPDEAKISGLAFAWTSELFWRSGYPTLAPLWLMSSYRWARETWMAWHGRPKNGQAKRCWTRPRLRGFHFIILSLPYQHRTSHHAMESAKLWVRDNCNMQRFRQVAEHPGVRKALSLKTPWVVLFIATCVLLVRYTGARQKQAWKGGRPRSPDPEKPTDLTTFAEKRMKPTERPPGSMRAPSSACLAESKGD